MSDRQATQALFDSLDLADQGQTEDLDRWIENQWGQGDGGRGDGAEDRTVIIVEADENEVAGTKNVSNLGSLLYVATVRDQPAAALHLLDNYGADPNYVHPDHGDTPLIHASVNGYLECLRSLLSCTLIRPELHRTMDRKILLGQATPLYEEGGRSALIMAAEEGRVEVVRILLDHLPKNNLEDTDSFGRNALRVVLDRVAVIGRQPEKVKTGKRGALIEVGRLLLSAEKGVEANAVTAENVELLVRDHDEAIQGERARSAVVRERCVEAAKLRMKEKRTRGLVAISSFYDPLHSDVYCRSAILDAAAEASTKTEHVRNLNGDLVVFSLLNNEFCSKIWEEVHHYETAALASCASSSSSLNDYHQLRNVLPVRVRHDGNLGDLQDCGFRPLLDVILEACCNILEKEYLPADSSVPDKKVFAAIEPYHAFVVRNSVDMDKNATYRMHRDKSDFTINLCLHASDDLEGSTVGFYCPPYCRENENHNDGSSSSTPQPPPGDSHRFHTHQHKVGVAVLHEGNMWHKTDPIAAGTRGSLIIWAKKIEKT